LFGPRRQLAPSCHCCSISLTELCFCGHVYSKQWTWLKPCMHHKQKGWHRLYKQRKVQVIHWGAQLWTHLGISQSFTGFVFGSCTLSAIILIFSTWSNQGYLLTKWPIHEPALLIVWGGSTHTLISRRTTLFGQHTRIRWLEGRWFIMMSKKNWKPSWCIWATAKQVPLGND